MKVLSVQQPWASLICAGIKDVENRTWKPAVNPGRILIHASSKKVTRSVYAGVPEDIVSFIENEISFGNFPELDTLPTSAIIGYVTVTGFEEDEVDSVWAAPAGTIKWKLEDAWLFDKPILNVKGKLNLFDYDEIDENNLPPAHQVELEDVELNDAEDEVFIPCEKNIFEKIKAGEFRGIELYLTPYLADMLCIENEYKMKSFKTVTVCNGNDIISFELAEGSGIYIIPDSQDETKPYMIYYPDGSECAWMTARFLLGKKLNEGETEEICGGKILFSADDILGKETRKDVDMEILKVEVSKEDFREYATIGATDYLKEITPNDFSTFFKTDENGKVIEINGNPQLRIYDAIQFVYNNKTLTFLVNDVDIAFLDDDGLVCFNYFDLPKEEREEYDYKQGLIYYALGKRVKDDKENRQAKPKQMKEKSDVPFLKTLAIRQPWASLIACGVKDIECRDSMPTKCRKIFVAASGKKVPWYQLDGMVKKVLTDLEKAGKLPSYDKLPQKCIIGYVDIVNVTYDPVESVWGRYHNGIKYVLENAHELDEYIYGKNKATPYFYNTEGYDENNLPAAHVVDLTGIDLPK